VPVKEVARHALPGPQAGMEAILVEVTSQPGALSTAHSPLGFVMGYVLEGEMRFAVNGQAPQVVKAGASFFEPFALSTAPAAAPNRAGRSGFWPSSWHPRAAIFN